MVLLVRQYYYSEDIANRFKSSFIYNDLDDVLDLRRDIKVLQKKASYADKIYEERGLNYDFYKNQMHEVLFC